MYIQGAETDSYSCLIPTIRMAVLVGLLGLLICHPTTVLGYDLDVAVLGLRRVPRPHSLSLVVAYTFQNLPILTFVVVLPISYAIGLSARSMFWPIGISFGSTLAYVLGAGVERTWTRSWRLTHREFHGQVFEPGGILVLARRLLVGLPLTVFFAAGLYYLRVQKGLPPIPPAGW